MADSAERGTKRKRPTFQHLPLNIAKKRKTLWVQNTKIKSKWKAQKRKEGISAGDDDDDEETEVPAPQIAGPSSKPRKSIIHPSRRQHHGLEPEESEPEREPEPLPTTKKQRKPTKGEESNSQPEQEKQKQSLRELTQKAYSPASLHTYKSDPLHRRSGKDAHRGGGQRGRGGRGGGRGQPNMQLRMGAMLERIKQDFA